MHTRSRAHTRLARKLSWLVVASLTFAALFAPSGNVAAASFNGAIWTSLSNGETVNANIYDAKEDVYLNGGPQNCGNGNGLPDGLYYFQVTDPSGSELLSSDAIKFRMVQVVNGVIAGVGGTGNHDEGTAGCNGGLPVQLMPYDDTPNNGGEYSVDLAPAGEVEACEGFDADSDTFNFLSCASSKNDNFKVGESEPTPTPVEPTPTPVEPTPTPVEPTPTPVEPTPTPVEPTPTPVEPTPTPVEPTPTPVEPTPTPVEPAFTVLIGTPECDGDVPYLAYEVDVTGTDADTVTITFLHPTDPSQDVVYEDLPFSGRVLWPGAVVDAEGNPIDWPGWRFENGIWVEGDEFDWVRPSVEVLFQVNPEATVTVDYPPATPLCDANPPEGEVGGATGTPGATLPPTDTIVGTATPSGDSWRLILLAMAGLLAAALLLTPASAVVSREERR
jgi:cell division septation protein DedD